MAPDLLLWSNKNYRYRLGGTRYDPSHIDWHTYLNKYCLNPDPANEYMDNNISSFSAMANGSYRRLNESLVPRIVPSSNLTLGWDGPWTFSDIMQTNFEESWMDSTGNLHVLCLSTHSAQNDVWTVQHLIGLASLTKKLNALKQKKSRKIVSITWYSKYIYLSVIAED